MNRRTRIKICGLRDPEMVAAAVAMHAWVRTHADFTEAWRG